MNIIKILQELVKTKDELHRLQQEIRYKAETVDKIASDLIEFLKDKRLIESKIVR